MHASNLKNVVILFVIACSLWVNTLCLAAGTPIKIKLAGRNLASFDPLGGNSDAYVIASYAYGTSEKYEVLGKTSYVTDSQHPDWKETFDVDFVPGTSQRMRFEVWDSDVDEDDFMGTVDVFLSEIAKAVDQPIEKYFLITPENGKLLIQNIAGNSNKTRSLVE